MSDAERQTLGDAELLLYPVSFAALDDTATREGEGEREALDRIEMFVCSLLCTTTTFSIEEVGDIRWQQVIARRRGLSAALAWHEPRLRLGRTRSVRALLDGAELWRRRGELSGRREDFDRAQELNARALEHAGEQPWLRARAMFGEAMIAYARAESAPDLVAMELARIIVRRAALFATGIALADGAADPEQDALALVTLILALSTDVAMAERVLSERTAARASASLEATMEAARDVRLVDRSDVSFALALLASRIEEVWDEFAPDGQTDRLDTAIEHSRRAFQLAHELQDGADVARAAALLARQLMKRWREELPRTAADELGEVLRAGLMNCVPLSASCVDLLGHWARVLHSTGVERERDDMLLVAGVIWTACCERLQERDAARCLTIASDAAVLIELARGSAHALPFHDFAITALRRLTREHGLEGHRGVWLSAASRVNVLAAGAHAAAGDAVRATEVAEDGRSVQVQSLIASPDAELDELRMRGHGALADRYVAAAREERAAVDAMPISGPIHNIAEDDFEAMLRRLSAAADRVREDKGAIRREPGFEAFPRPLSYQELRAAAVDAPLAYVVPGANAGSILLVRSPQEAEPERIVLPGLTYNEANEHALAYQKAYRAWDPDRDGLAGWPEQLDSVGGWLWEMIVGPLLDALDGAPFVRIIQLGYLMFLPLHMAWTPTHGGRTYALERTAFAYIPSAAALLHARRRPVSAAWRALVVDDPELDLLDTSTEIAAVERRFEGRAETLRGAEATVEAVRSALPRHNFAHISAHGFLNEMLPLMSGIVLAGGEQLSVHALRGIALEELELLILSSCETGMAGGRALDESISFPGMLYGTASRAVIAAQWAVDQAATSAVFERFYEHWDLSHEPADIAQALRQAQLDVRAAGREHPVWWGGFALFG